jgi:hypothetical protein
LQRQLRGLTVGRVQACQPLPFTDLARQRQRRGQRRIELQLAVQRPLPPARPQLLLEVVEVAGLALQLLVSMARQQRLDQGPRQRQRHVGRGVCVAPAHSSQASASRPWR